MPKHFVCLVEMLNINFLVPFQCLKSISASSTSTKQLCVYFIDDPEFAQYLSCELVEGRDSAALFYCWQGQLIQTFVTVLTTSHYHISIVWNLL